MILHKSIAEYRDHISVIEKAVGARSGEACLFIPDASHGLVETSVSLIEEFKGVDKQGGCRERVAYAEKILESVFNGETKKYRASEKLFGDSRLTPVR